MEIKSFETFDPVGTSDEPELPRPSRNFRQNNDL